MNRNPEEILTSKIKGRTTPNWSAERWSIDDWREACSILLENRDLHLRNYQQARQEVNRLKAELRKCMARPYSPGTADDYDNPRMKSVSATQYKTYLVRVASPIRGFKDNTYAGTFKLPDDADAAAIELWCRLVESHTGHDVAEILETGPRCIQKVCDQYPLRRERDE